MMKKSVSPSLTVSSWLLCLVAGSQQCWACNSGTPGISALGLPEDTYSISGLNSQGKLTGWFSDGTITHAFLYDGVVSDLGTLGGSISEGVAINSSGMVVGGSYTGTQFDAFLYDGSNTNLVDLGTLGGAFSSASAINNLGQIVGNSTPLTSSDNQAFLYFNGTLQSLGTFGGTYSSAYALNNSGQVVGEASLDNGDIHAFVSSAAGLVDLGTLGGTYSSAYDLNDAGVIVGEAAVDSANTHAFVYANGVMTDIGNFGGDYSSAYHVNTNNQVIGFATTADDAEYRAFVYSDGNLIDLGDFGGAWTVPYAINNLGQIVGEATLGNGIPHAFLWQSNQLVDLNTVLPADSGWELSSAQFINDNGRIVGYGTLNGVSRVFILDLVSGNNAPVAIAGADQTVDCQTQVTLDGSLSSDPDNDVLAFEWTSGGTLLGTSPTLSTSFPLGTNVVTLKVSDPCGASSETNVTVIVADNTPPTGSCPAAVTASADAHCQAAVPDFASQVSAHDNCTPDQSLMISQDPPAGTLVGLGQLPVTITVTDTSGNRSTCSVLFTVADRTPPTIVSTPAPFSLSVSANCQAEVPNVLAGLEATDSCTPSAQLTKSQSPAPGSLVGVGNHTLTVTVTDAAGNSSSALVAFSVADTTPPQILSAPDSVKLAADAHCQAVVPNLLASVLANDNCTPVDQLSMTQTPAAGTILSHGDYLVAISVKDASGNATSLNVPLSIVDTTAPVFQSLVASPDTLSPPNHQLVAVSVAPVVIDNCDATPKTKIVAITCSEQASPGEIQITGDLNALLAASKSSSGDTRFYYIKVQSTDNSGNSSYAVVTVSVPKSSGNGNGTLNTRKR